MNITKIMAKQDLELYIFKKRRRPLGEDRSKKNANLTIKHSKKYKRINWAILIQFRNILKTSQDVTSSCTSSQILSERSNSTQEHQTLFFAAQKKSLLNDIIGILESPSKEELIYILMKKFTELVAIS